MKTTLWHPINGKMYNLCQCVDGNKVMYYTDGKMVGVGILKEDGGLSEWFDTTTVDGTRSYYQYCKQAIKLAEAIEKISGGDFQIEPPTIL